MKKVAIVGGGIAGLAAAWELEVQRRRGAAVDWTLYEASARLGGVIDTTRRDGFVLEGGPDGWVTEKPWARELAVELGLDLGLDLGLELGLEPGLDLRLTAQMVGSCDATRKTYVLLDGALQAMPDRMRMMVPEDLAALEGSPMFSASARAAYASELARADPLRASAPTADESVASFVRRHFGDEVLAKIAAPLLGGVFGGDVERLSVRAVMPAFVTMEREHGSLIAAARHAAQHAAAQHATAQHREKTQASIFTTLRDGMGTLVDALVARLPAQALLVDRRVLSLKREGKRWCVRTAKPAGDGRIGKSKQHFTDVFLACPADAARSLLSPLIPEAGALLPTHASSAVLVALCWRAAAARTFHLPPGFGFLVPQGAAINVPQGAALDTPKVAAPQMLACTFVDQKFPQRTPEGGRCVRVFFGGASCAAFAGTSDDAVAASAFAALKKVLGDLPTPDPALTVVRRWPHSLPQYEVGHLERIAELEQRVGSLGGLHLIGNSYHGVGIPDIIRDARAAVARLFA